MKEEDETVFEYFQRNQIDFLENTKAILCARIEALEKLCVHKLGSQYLALLEAQMALIDDYKLFLDEFNGAEMYLKELEESIKK
ncbi:hypothetical protein [Pseudomonas helleri]|uniref:hypothetical protein n=1 Tax=Pseudomonas helleri TaxID=1608996 RepID=UPI00129778BE|nr:hypothetical protein [Pseudomonas helleri]MQT35304.1 hypothetical protein [Pseudomonas helleri]